MPFQTSRTLSCEDYTCDLAAHLEAEKAVQRRTPPRFKTITVTEVDLVVQGEVHICRRLALGTHLVAIDQTRRYLVLTMDTRNAAGSLRVRLIKRIALPLCTMYAWRRK